MRDKFGKVVSETPPRQRHRVMDRASCCCWLLALCVGLKEQNHPETTNRRQVKIQSLVQTRNCGAMFFFALFQEIACSVQLYREGGEADLKNQAHFFNHNKHTQTCLSVSLRSTVTNYLTVQPTTCPPAAPMLPSVPPSPLPPSLRPSVPPSFLPCAICRRQHHHHRLHPDRKRQKKRDRKSFSPSIKSSKPSAPALPDRLAR